MCNKEGKEVTGPQDRRVKYLTTKVLQESRAIQLKYATLSGKYEKAKRATKDILDLRGDKELFFKKMDENTKRDIKKTMEAYKATNETTQLRRYANIVARGPRL